MTKPKDAVRWDREKPGANGSKRARLPVLTAPEEFGEKADSPRDSPSWFAKLRARVANS